MPGTIYHKNGHVAYQGSGTNAGYAYHDNGNTGYIASGTAAGFGYHRNGQTAFVGPGRTNSGYAYRADGSLISRDGSGLSYSLGPGIRIRVNRSGCEVYVDEPLAGDGAEDAGEGGEANP